MTIQRCPEDGKNPYIRIPLSLIDDHSISLECRGLIMYLLSSCSESISSLDEIWENHKNTLSKKRLIKLFDEAIEAGYIKRKILIKEDGRSVHRYVIYSTAWEE